VKITRNQLKQLIKKELNEVLPLGIRMGQRRQQESNFPFVSHPIISQYADDMRGPIKHSPSPYAEQWFKEYVSYTYAPRENNIQAKQSIVLYLLTNDKYTARINGSYNNTVSGSIGEFDDPIRAIQVALNSSVTNTPPVAKDLINKVGTKIDPQYSVSSWPD
jgi:hypothetical protein